MMDTQSVHPLEILLADDGSEHARAAVALLEDLPLPPEAKITALRVFTPTQSSEHAIFQAALDQTQAQLQSKGLQVATELLLGYPAEKIIEYADAHRPDLIVLGAKGLRATFGILLGGVAQQVVEYAQWPVLVVRAPYQGLRHVLLVVDGSPYSKAAVNYLCGGERCARFPLPKGVELHVMHVLPPILPPVTFVDARFPGVDPLSEPIITARLAQQAGEERQGGELIEQTIALLKSQGLEATGVLPRGDAATEIIAYVHANPVDLIVAGSRGLSQVRGWLMGSVSRKLIHYSGCSVLIAKGAASS
jgi:nucleotide-binding universal stress UspA family protein